MQVYKHVVAVQGYGSVGYCLSLSSEGVIMIKCPNADWRPLNKTDPDFHDRLTVEELKRRIVCSVAVDGK